MNRTTSFDQFEAASCIIADAECSSSEFCGIDNVCHSITCENAYNYIVGTLYDEDLPELNCVEFLVDGVSILETKIGDMFTTGVSTFEAFPNRYSCPDDDEDIVQHFTRYCTANPYVAGFSELQFQCHEMAEDTDYNIFLKQAASKECNGNYTNNGSVAVFSDIKNKKYRDSGMIGLGNDTVSPTFIPVKNSIFVLYEEMPTTPVPTFSPTISQMPLATSISPASFLGLSSLFLVLESLFVAVAWMIL